MPSHAAGSTQPYGTPMNNLDWDDTPAPEEDTLDDDDLAFGFRHFDEALKAQRQSDLKKISFHAGIDLKTLQGYLESKVER